RDPQLHRPRSPRRTRGRMKREDRGRGRELESTQLPCVSLPLGHQNYVLAQSRDDLIRRALAGFHCAFEITLSVDGSMFAAEMDTFLRLSFDSRKAGILTDAPIAVAAETVRITCPPIDCGKTIPLRAQTRPGNLQHAPLECRWQRCRRAGRRYN